MNSNNFFVKLINKYVLAFWPYYLFALFFGVYFVDLISDPAFTVFGNFDDSLDLIWSGWIYKNFGEFTQLYGYPTLRKIYVIGPQLIWTVYFALTKFFNEISSYNILFTIGYFLTFVFSFKLFEKILKSTIISFFIALLFTFSPYHYYQSLTHLDLGQIWIIPMFYITSYKFLRKQSFKNF